MVLKILTNVKRLLNAGKVNVPLADSVNLYVAVVEHSTPERTMNVAGENLGEHALILSLAEYTALLYNVGVVELYVLRLKSYNVDDYHNKRYNEPEEKYSPELKSGKNALSCNKMRSVYVKIHFFISFSTAAHHRNVLTTILYKNISELSISNDYFLNTNILTLGGGTVELFILPVKTNNSDERRDHREGLVNDTCNRSARHVVGKHASRHGESEYARELRIADKEADDRDARSKASEE